MAIGVLIEVTGPTLEMYDAVNAELGDAGSLEPGQIIHTAGATDGGFRIFEVWESREAMDRFVEEKLRPAIDKVSGGQAPRPDPTIYELHNVVTA